MDHTIVRIMLGICIICNSSELGEGQQKTQLSACGDTVTSLCVLNPVGNESVCRGEDVSASVTLKLSQSMTQDVTVGNIGVYRGSYPILVGFSKNPSFSGKNRWEVSHMISATEDKSCLITVTVHVNNVQPDDEFMSHIEIQLSDEIISTSDEMWFKVSTNCSHQPDKVKGTEEPDKRDYSDAPLPESTTDILIKNLTQWAHNPVNNMDIRTDDIVNLINKNTTMITIVLVAAAGMIVFMLYPIVKSCYRRWKMWKMMNAMRKEMSALNKFIEEAMEEELQRMDQLVKRRKNERKISEIEIEGLRELREKNQMMANFTQLPKRMQDICKTDLFPTELVKEGTSHEDEAKLLERTAPNEHEILKEFINNLNRALAQNLPIFDDNKLGDAHKFDKTIPNTERAV